MQQHKTMKDLPDWQRPYEKCKKQGPESLSDAELLAVIIRVGLQGELSTDIAENVLNAGPDGLLNLIYLSREQLKAVRGIGEVRSIQLKSIGELARRIASATRRDSVSLTSPSSIAAYYMETLRHERQEKLLLAMFNMKCKLLGEKLLSVGTSQASLVSPADIYRTALEARAAFIVLLHNHPSGNPEPSSADLEITRQVLSCGNYMGIPLQDHIIIGDNNYFSFLEHNILKTE